MLGLVVGTAGLAAFGHGASRGLHLHLAPDPAPRGERITVEIDAIERVERVRAGFVGQPAVEHEPDPPARHLEVRLVVPPTAKGDTLNCQVEVRTTGGETLRASAVRRVSDPPAPPEKP